MSLGGGANKAIDEAVNNAIKAGISVVVAAGNSNANACDYSPARVKAALTVAASTKKDSRASFSNWGPCVDIFAPGQDIISSWHDLDEAYRSLSGTSMASPHVAGAVALALGVYPKWTPSELSKLLIRTASLDKIDDLKDSPNSLMYVNDLGGVPTVSAGEDLVKRFPVGELLLTAKASDKDGYIVETKWTQLEGPPTLNTYDYFDWQQDLLLKDLSVGSYVFRFSAWDNDGLYAHDDVRVLVSDQNLLPVADAGKDQKVKLSENIVLSGQKSFDQDGDIVSYGWQQVSGPNVVKISSPNSVETEVEGVVSGQYLFQLKVEDNEEGQSFDEII